MIELLASRLADMVALRKESVDRNRKLLHPSCTAKMSLSARRAWIEICIFFSLRLPIWASLSARRAWIEISKSKSRLQKNIVALRKESVDRNRKLLHPSCTAKMSLSARRAWIEICIFFSLRLPIWASLSARRAWIEISKSKSRLQKNIVALRKESVDRNLVCTVLGLCCDTVALRKESVDRNLGNVRCLLEKCRRSPQGERG